MAEDQEPTGPSLEPPTLFRRRRKSRPEAPPEPEPPADDSPTTVLDDVPAAAAPAPTASLGPKPTAPPLFADEVPAAAPAPSDATVSSAAPVTNTNGSRDEPGPARRAPRDRDTPLVPGRVAAAMVGLVVGGLIVGLTYASFGLCEQVKGTDSCGGPGIFLLLAILVGAVVFGAVVLRLLMVPEPGSTSFLAVGLTSVIALLFLVDELFEWWMLIAIPVVSVATYLLSHWVTTTFVEPGPQVGLASEPETVDHDVP